MNSRRCCRPVRPLTTRTFSISFRTAIVQVAGSTAPWRRGASKQRLRRVIRSCSVIALVNSSRQPAQFRAPWTFCMEEGRHLARQPRAPSQSCCRRRRRNIGAQSSMASDLDLLSRLLAFEAGKAVPIASHLQLAIRPDALVLCPIAMAGEDARIHVVASGVIGDDAEVRCIPNPKLRDDEYELFAWLGRKIERYYMSCRLAGTYPQLWVASAAAAGLLDTLADRLRYNRHNPLVKRFGELLSYATERFPIPGQQALHTVTGALRAHYATGQQEGEDEHLGTLLTWIEPPRQGNLLAAVALAEMQPMGVKTDPTFDRDVLAPLLSRYNSARRNGASSTALARRAKQIQDALEPVVMPIYDESQRAIRILGSRGLPPLADLGALEQREAEEFASFMNSRDAGYHLPLRDRPKSAAFKLAAREDAAQNVEAAVIYSDKVERARARLGGRILTGMAENPSRIHVGPRRFEHRIDVVSSQRILRLRRGDELSLLEDPRLKGRVTDIRRSGGKTRVSLVVTHGARAVGLPTARSIVELGPNAPDWTHLARLRGQMSARLSTLPWTHDGTGMPAPTRQPLSPPSDLLAAVETLR